MSSVSVQLRKDPYPGSLAGTIVGFVAGMLFMRFGGSILRIYGVVLVALSAWAAIFRWLKSRRVQGAVLEDDAVLVQYRARSYRIPFPEVELTGWSLEDRRNGKRHYFHGDLENLAPFLNQLSKQVEVRGL